MSRGMKWTLVLATIVIAASLIHSGKAIGDELTGEEDERLTFDQCREEGERAVLMHATDTELRRMKRMRNRLARQMGAMELP